MRKRFMTLLAVLMAFALFAAACGGDDDAGVDTDDDAAPATTAEAADSGDGDAMEDDAMEDDEGADHSDDGDAMADEDGEAMADSDGDGPQVGLVYDIGGRGDLSFNDSAASGLERAAADLGSSATELEPNDDGSNRAELLQLSADESDIVIGVGFLFADDVKTVAAANPDTNFAVVDDAMLDFDNGGVPFGDNIAGLTFAEHEGSFLVGAAAALKSQTGQIGFIGGVSGFGLIEKFEAGFEAGAQAVNPDIEIVTSYITEFPDFDGFNSPDRARETALAMYEGGADIIYHAAGGAGLGMFEAAKSHSEDSGSKVWGIGVDSDQFNTVSPDLQEYVLTSMLKRVDSSVFQIIESQKNGSFSAGNVVYDLSTDGVGYSTTGGFVDDISGDLEAFKAQIVNGEIEVPTVPAGG